MNHANLIKQTLKNGNKLPGTRLWSNPVGFGYNGKVIKNWSKNGKRYMVLENPRPVTYGLCPGSLDIIGFHVVENRPVFAAIDAKTPGDNPSPIQKRFIGMISKFNGFAGVLRKEGDLYEIFKI